MTRGKTTQDYVKQILLSLNINAKHENVFENVLPHIISEINIETASVRDDT